MAILEKDLAKLARSRQARVNGRRNLGKEIEYPEGDGKPMAETDQHRKVMFHAIEAAETLLAHRSDVYISGNNCFYANEGDNRFVSPDCYVVLGVEPKRERRTFKVWEEDDRFPSFILETTSRKTRREDETIKAPLYQSWGVEEYFRFDPTGDYLNPRLQGSRLVNGVYVPIEMIDGRLASEVLNAFLFAEGEMLRFIDRRTGKLIPTAAEDKQRANAEAERANAEAERAKMEAGRASAEAERANAEAEARSAAEQEVARLRAALEAALAGQSPGYE